MMNLICLTGQITMLNTTNTKFLFIEVWFTDQNSKQIEIEDNINMTLIMG